MRKSLVAGNWKLNGSLESVESLASGVADLAANVSCEVVLCPVFLHLERVARVVGDRVKLGAQNSSAELSGAFTGEVSPEMLKEVGCDYVILGHSERRTLFAETDQQIAEKVKSVLAQKMYPILCVGETLEERESGKAEEIVKSQLVAALVDVAAQLESVVIAYEPVWAIGTGLTATPDQAQSMHAFIRDVLAEISEPVAQKVQILYGGSVKPENAEELFGQADIDGGLIGGASLKVDDFIAICKAAG